MKKIYLPLALLLAGLFTTAQLFSQSIEDKEFGKVPINTNKTETIMINSGANGRIDLVSAEIVGTSDAFTISSFSPTRLTENSNAQITVNFNGNDNVNYTSYLLVKIKTEKSEYSLVSKLSAEATHSNTIYAGSDNLKGSALIAWLSSFVTPHTVFSYKDARIKMWGTIDNVDGDVECIYTGRKVTTDGIPDVSLTKFDTEHTWPQSLGADDEPPKSDLYHIRPTYQVANSTRGNYPFGFVANGITWEEAGSKLGNDAVGRVVFEPRDKFKGDVARGLYYFAIRYGNPTAFINNQEKDLRQFMNIDPVDEVESTRCQAIASYQNNHNPFVENVHFFERFNTIASPDLIKKPIVRTAEDTLFFVNQIGAKSYVNLINIGDTSLVVESIELLNPNQDMLEFIMQENFTNPTITPDNKTSIYVELTKAPSETTYSSTMNIKFVNGESKTIVLKTKDIILSAKDNQATTNIDLKVSPNPMTNQSTITITGVDNFANSTLNLVTVDGKKIDISKMLNLGYDHFTINKSDMPCTNCMIYLNFNHQNQIITKPIIVE